MNRRDTILALLGLGIASAQLRVSAQTARPARPMRIGLLPAINETYRKWIAGFMRESGWTEGRDFNFVWFECSLANVDGGASIWTAELHI